MSDDERLDLRNLPPLPELPWPERFSQTFLRHADNCKRSAWLYVKYRGGTPSHALDRGSLAHAVFERMTLTLIEQGASSLVEVEAGEDPARAAQAVASHTAAIVDEVYREHPELTVPVGGVDAVRVMAYHWATGFHFDPSKVVAVERKFVLDVAGREVTGKVDLAYIGDGGVAGVDDYKTQFNVPDQESFDESFQTKLYSAMLLFGHPLRKENCTACGGSGVNPGPPDVDEGGCESCGGSRFKRGRGYTEIREEPLGAGINWVRGRELYPRFLRKDGSMQYREKVRSRTEIRDFLQDVERLVQRTALSMDTGLWPAVPGSHCSQCPCKPECPLPPTVRQHAGTINTAEQAADTWAALELVKDDNAALQKEIRNWVKAHGPLRYGKDMVLELVPEESQSTDWDGVERGVFEAVNYGAPFALTEHRKPRVSMRLKSRRLTAEELEAESGQEVSGDGARFGDDAPF